MSRFFINETLEVGKLVIIKDENFHHIKNVLRHRPGDSITICDSRGKDYIVTIERIYKDCLEGMVEESFLSKTEPMIRVTLYQGLPKADKFEYIIQKSVELGVCEIVPVITKRCIVKLDEGTASKKVDRWQKISYEAAKQCNRGIIPQIREPILFKDALLEAQKSDLCVIPYENESKNSLKKILTNLTSNPVNISFFIGPEGGFEEDEILLANNNSITSVSLGPRILRTETAGLAVLSILMYQLGDLG